MNLTAEEIELARYMGIEIPTPKKQVVKKPAQYKIIRVITNCSLCLTVTEQYFSMVSREDFTWVSEEEIFLSKHEVPKGVETVRVRVNTCAACKETLRKKDKDVLIALLIDFYSFHVKRLTMKEAEKKVITEGMKI